MKAEDIVRRGKIDIKVRRAGVLQFQEFVVKKDVCPDGEYPYLFIDKFVEIPELMRIAEEYGIPVEAKNGRVFPRGKMAKDFVKLLKR